jgi:hypothetical protein
MKAEAHLRHLKHPSKRAYYCAACDGWHIGSPQPWRNYQSTFKRREVVRLEDEALV